MISYPSALTTDAQLRESLLTFLLETATGAELAEWLRDIGQDARGSVEDRKQRIRTHTKYLSMPAEEFPRQTETYLATYPSELLGDLCDELGLSSEGNKDARYRRILREIHYREGWFPRFDTSAATPTAEMVMAVLGWFPITKSGNYEKHFYPVIHEELTEVFGSMVYQQLPVAHGSTLKIDFHVGDPQVGGIGVEVKMPTNNAEVQRTLGQLDQYQRRYGNDLVLFVLDEMKPETSHFFKEELKRKNVRGVFR